MINGMCCIAIDFLNGLGPNPETLSDFIQMIWDQKPPVVVMLTRLFEKSKVSTQITMTAQICKTGMGMSDLVGILYQ